MSAIVPVQPLTRFELECLAVQWDGTQEHSATITDVLAADLRGRDAWVGVSRFRRSSREAPKMALAVAGPHRVQMGGVLYAGDWFVVWLRYGKVHLAEVLKREDGDRLFADDLPAIPELVPILEA